MPHTQMMIAFAAAAALLAPVNAAAQAETADAGVAAERADAGSAEPDLGAPFVPGVETPASPEEPAGVKYEDDASASTDKLPDLPDGKPYAKGDMEPSFGLGFAGYDTAYYMMIGGSFAYYVVNRFAPGLEVTYGTDFGSADIPDDVTLLPFAKFVILRSTKFAPYLIAQVGREFEFAGANAVHSWIAGAGVGANIGLGAHFVLKIEVTFQHHWYDDPRIRRYDDKDVARGADGTDYYCPTGDCPVDDWTEEYVQDGAVFQCLDADNPTEDTCAQVIDDKKDIDREWIFPIVTLGAAFLF
jgi:hypothetical protein